MEVHVVRRLFLRDRLLVLRAAVLLFHLRRGRIRRSRLYRRLGLSRRRRPLHFFFFQCALLIHLFSHIAHFFPQLLVNDSVLTATQLELQFFDQLLRVISKHAFQLQRPELLYLGRSAARLK